MFQSWSFPTVDISNAVRVAYRQAMEAENASMGKVGKEHVEHFWA
jgi:hypothetical protein